MSREGKQHYRKERKGKKDIKERESIIEVETTTNIANLNLYNQKICAGDKLALDKNHRTAITISKPNNCVKNSRKK